VNVVGNAIEQGMGGGNPVGWGTAFAAGFGRDLSTIVDGVRARAPNAKIILLNPPNGAGLPYVATRPRDQLRVLQAISVRFSAEANVQASRGVLVVDLMCDPRAYLPSNFSSDGFHPNDAGYAFMAEAVLNAVNASSLPPPRSDCPQMHLAD
jgi:lysophospholipase L1-like esterase